MVLSMDTGAALGLVDAVQSVLLKTSAPKIRLVNIKVKKVVKYFRMTFIIKPHMIERLHTVGLQTGEVIIELPPSSGNNVENKLFSVQGKDE